MKKDIFLLDADDTVLDFHGASARGIRDTLIGFGKEWKDEYGSQYKTLNDGFWQRLERGELTREKLLEIRFPTYLKGLGFEDISGEAFNEKYLHYIANNPMFMDGAEEFLHKLPNYGRVYIVTNGSYSIQQSRFRIVEMQKYVSDVFVSQRIGADKPSPVYTQFVLEHIPNFSKARAVWIGDSLSADIKAANEAGIDSIWYNPKNKPLMGDVSPTFTASSFNEIEKILEIL
ncbi:MAG: YjjG family noncanonical pyrimidine nucleotidase [Clostridia bacterium]|nr:YjjG family noncanonical pyrimidine nucleotidase [Clostridia bacterium]